VICHISFKGKIIALLENKVQPDVGKLLDVIRRRIIPSRVHYIELDMDEEIKRQLCVRFNLSKDTEPGGSIEKLKRDIRLYAFLGYDAFRFNLGTEYIFSLSRLGAADTTDIAAQSRSRRDWADEHTGPIQSWQDFESFKWPKVADVDFAPFEWLQKNLPQNMGCYDLTANILEMTTWLFGYETLCYKIFDAPDLVDAIFQKVGSFFVDFTRTLCDFSCVCLIWGSDDMGFRTSTLVSHKILREKVLPWHRQCAQIAHEHNLPYLLHCCGNLGEIMDDLIDYVGIDAKHSFEDAIMPVTEAKKKYGSRVTLLGGIDMDFLCRSDEKAIRKRVMETLAVCMPGGGYCLGTGNTVANYVPVDNYLIMLDEGRKFPLS
jgi:uroporphyrinogen decarboxylase